MVVGRSDSSALIRDQGTVPVQLDCAFRLTASMTSARDRTTKRVPGLCATTYPLAFSPQRSISHVHLRDVSSSEHFVNDWPSGTVDWPRNNRAVCLCAS